MLRILRILGMYFYFGPLSVAIDFRYFIGFAVDSMMRYFQRLPIPTFLSRRRVPFLSGFSFIFNKIKSVPIWIYSDSSRLLKKLTYPVVDYFWEDLLQDLNRNGFSKLIFMGIKCCLYFKPEIINQAVRINDENLKLIDILLLSNEVRFDVINYLIKIGATFDQCAYPKFMFDHCPFFERYQSHGDALLNEQASAYYSNSLYFLAECVRNLSLDSANPTKHQKAKQQFKKIIDHIITQHGANYCLPNGIPLIAYMPDRELVEYLIEKGASADLTIEQTGKNLQETLLDFGEFERLCIFLELGFKSFRDLKTQVLEGDFSRACFCLRNPALAEQLSDIDKAHLITANAYRGRRRTKLSIDIFRLAHITSYSKLTNFELCREPRGDFIDLLADIIFDLGKKSEEIYKMFYHFNIFIRLLKHGKPQYPSKVSHLREYWEEKDNKIHSKAFRLTNQECLPEGIVPQFEIETLDEGCNSYVALQSNARKILGVSDTDSNTAILHAYRRLSLAHHPDRSKSIFATEEMACLNKAKTILLG